MIAILKVGSAHFAMEAKDATKVLELLGKGMRVESSWVSSKSRIYYFPATESSYRDELTVEVMDSSRILSAKPEDEEPLPPPIATTSKRVRQLGSAPKRPLLGFNS